MEDKTVNPFPDLVDPRKKSPKAWDVRPSMTSSRVDKRNRIMMLSVGPERRDAARHELGHIRWSPVNVPTTDYNPWILQAVEDARINVGLERAGVPLAACDETAEDLRDLFAANADDPLATIIRAVACTGDQVAEGIARQALSKLADRKAAAIGHAWLDRLAITMRGQRGAPVQPFTVAEQEAKRLAAELAQWAKEEEAPQEQEQEQPTPVESVLAAGSESSEQGEQEAPGNAPGNGAGGFSGKVEGFKTDDQRRDQEADPIRAAAVEEGRKAARSAIDNGGRADLAKPVATSTIAARPMDRAKLRAVQERAEQRANERAAARLASEARRVAAIGARQAATRTRVFGDGGNPESGVLRIETPPLVIPQPNVAANAARLPRCSTEGSMIRRPDRYMIDRAIFARLAKREGAVVLLDQSGSMSVSPEETEALCLAAGRGAVVATYSGGGGEGVLRIVASGSMRAAPEAFEAFMGGNCVDFAALRWLSQQPGRRLWVSDGGVSNVRDQRTETIVEAVRALTERSGITRAHRIDVACAMLRERR